MSISDKLSKLGPHANDCPDTDVALIEAKDLVTGTVLLTCDGPGHYEFVGQVTQDAAPVTKNAVKYCFGKITTAGDEPKGSSHRTENAHAKVLVQASSL